MNTLFKLNLIIFLLVIINFNSISAVDYLVADNDSINYRIGVIDPIVHQIPNEINDLLYSAPDIYLEKLILFFKLSNPNDFELIKRIHDWITLTIVYDDYYFYGSDYGSNNPSSFLKLQRTTCCGYAIAYARVLLYNLLVVYLG